MDETEKIHKIIIDIESIKLGVARLVANAESEKEVRRDTNIEMNKRIGEIDKLVRTALYDHDTGFLVKLDRVILKSDANKNELAELDKQTKEISHWKIHQQGSMKVVIWMVSIASAVLIGVIVSILT